MDTRLTGNDYGISADVMRLLRSAATGKFNSDMLPANLATSELAEILTNLTDARNAVDLNPIAMLTLDTDLNFIEANNSALELFGWTREETLRQNVNDLNVLDVKGDHVAVSIREKRLTACEVTLRCPKGVLVLKTWAAPLLDGDGNVRAALMELIDITAEKKEAADTAAWYESILDAVQFPITVTDLKMRWTFVNEAAEKLIGRKKTDLLGKSCTEWNTEICNTGQCAIARLRQGETRTLFGMSGNKFQVDAAYAKDADGKAIGHVEIIENITGRTRVSEYMECEVMRLAGNLERLAHGNLDFDLAVAKADEYTREVQENFVLIAEDLGKAKEAISLVIADADRLTKGAAAGNLGLRADVSKHRGDYRAILEGMNDVLDAIVAPLEMALDYLDQIARGDTLQRITAEYQGDFNKIKVSVNQCIDGLGALVETNQVLQRMAVNDYSVQVAGNYPGFYGQIASAITLVQERVNHIAETVERISHGDLSELDTYRKIGRRSEQDKLVPAFIRTFETLQTLTGDMEWLTRAARNGDLGKRADVAKHEGEYRKIVEGINATLDVVSAPLEVTLNYIDQIGRGEIPEKITAEYHGDFDKLKQSLNQCIDGLGGLTEANHVLQRMAINDHTKRVAGKYQGVFAEVATAVNLVQDRINHVAEVVERISHGNLSDREVIEKMGRLSEQDRLAPSVLRTLVTLETLTDDMAGLTGAAQKGDLGKRVEVTKHEGEYRKIVEGVNSTLDVIVDPFKKVQDAIVQLESSTQDTSKSSDEIAKAAEQVAVTSQKCADLSKQVLREIEGIESQMADLSASNEEIAGTSQEVLNATTETAELGKGSLKLGEATKDKMAVVEKISRQSMDEIVRLNSQMAEIGKIVKLINDIANQTNLLALNAAIEAARAGEHGRGFAVVAGEIRNLAGESKNASHNIEELIASIVTNSNQTAKNMEQVYQEIEEGVESVNRTIEELKEIVAGSERISGDMGEITRAIENQANVANRVVEAMGEGSRLTKDNQAEMENLASLSEETSASTEEIGSAAHELNGMANELKETMQRFSF